MLAHLSRGLRLAAPAKLRHFSSASGTMPFRVQDGFIRQNRPGERQLVDVFRPKNGGNEIRIERMDEQDLEMCTQMATDVFARSCQMFTDIGIGVKESRPFWHKVAVPCVNKNNVSLLAFDGDKLVSHLQTRTQTRDEYVHNFPYGLHYKNPKLEFMSDYAEMVANGPYATKDMNCVHVCFSETIKQAGKFLPSDVNVLETAEVMGTHQAYFRTGVMQRLIELHCELVREKKVDFCILYCLVNGSAALLRKYGYKDMFEFPYNRFKVDGKLIWDTLSDGATGIQVVGRYMR